MPAQSYLNPQILPKGAAMLVTNEIMAKMKNIVIIATLLLPCACAFCAFAVAAIV